MKCTYLGSNEWRGDAPTIPVGNLEDGVPLDPKADWAEGEDLCGSILASYLVAVASISYVILSTM